MPCDSCFCCQKTWYNFWYAIGFMIALHLSSDCVLLHKGLRKVGMDCMLFPHNFGKQKYNKTMRKISGLTGNVIFLVK